MPDGFSIVLRGVNELEREFTRIDKSVNRATMWAVREAGRKVKQQAKRSAPRKTGRLRASIHSSKRLIGHDGTWAVRVAPRGLEVHFYSGKTEAEAGYMAKGYGAVAPQLEEIAARAWLRATRGRR